MGNNDIDIDVSFEEWLKKPNNINKTYIIKKLDSKVKELQEELDKELGEKKLDIKEHKKKESQLSTEWKKKKSQLCKDLIEENKKY